jgi:hypothetical protein
MDHLRTISIIFSNLPTVSFKCASYIFDNTVTELNEVSKKFGIFNNKRNYKE